MQGPLASGATLRIAPLTRPLLANVRAHMIIRARIAIGLVALTTLLAGAFR